MQARTGMLQIANDTQSCRKQYQYTIHFLFFHILGYYLNFGGYQYLNIFTGDNIRGVHKGDDRSRDAG